MAHKPDGREDLRIQRSRKLLQQALFELTVEQGFAAVTVRDITERARVNRSTFYRHYLDKYDLLNQYLDDLQGVMTAAVSSSEHAQSPAPEGVPAGLWVLVRHVQEHAGFYRVMLGQHGDPRFAHRFRQISETRFRDLLARTGDVTAPNAPPSDLQLSYISYAGVGAILWWLENNQPASAEQFAVWLCHLSMTSAGLI